MRDAYDRFVFFGAASFSLRVLHSAFVHSSRQPWAVCVVPVWLAEQLPERAFLEREVCEYEIRSSRTLRWRTGRPAAGADIARRWSQRIGFRAALLLLERGRVSHGLISHGKDLERWTRAKPPFESQGPGLVRLEASELLAAMRASGGPIAKRPRLERFEVGEAEAAQ